MFISFEGIDGSGKTTQAKLFSDWLCKRGCPVLLTREPGGWDGSSPLREMVISGELRHPWSEACLFMLDRAEHVARVIEPALAAGTHVICERYHDSTLAYQVWGRGLPLEIFNTLAKEASFPIPDFTILFDVSVGYALSRVTKRGRPDAFESEGESFMSRVRNGYLSLAEKFPGRFIVIDANNSDINTVFLSVVSALNQRGYFNG